MQRQLDIVHLSPVVLAIAIAMLSGCISPVTEDDISLDAEDPHWIDETTALRPFHVARFDHYPSAAEIEQDLADFAAKHPVANLNPTNPGVPLPGQKRVTVLATTADIPRAGSDVAPFFLLAHWRTGDGRDYTEQLLLDNPTIDDLDRGTVSVFHYFMSLSSYAPRATSDQFIQAKITTTSTDGWFCEHVEMFDMNSQGTARVQQLPFNQWVDAPHASATAFYPATNSDHLSYSGE